MSSVKKYLHLKSILKLALILTLLYIIFTYATGTYYKQKHKNDKLFIGASFSQEYAESFGLDPKKVLEDSINDLGIKNYRLNSHWDIVEKNKGEFDFSELDWQFDTIENSGGTVSLSLGLRQPRWPECHLPKWANELKDKELESAVKNFIKKTVERYRDRKSLINYQLENEYFLSKFGKCKDFSRERLINEFNLVKELDSKKDLIISRSFNLAGFAIRKPIPDVFAISIYKKFYSQIFIKAYINYPHPAIFYSSLAGIQELIYGKRTINHELQMEAWTPDGYSMNNTEHIPEQYKSMSPEDVAPRIDFAINTGMHEFYVWGIEWWYWLKENKHPEMWNNAKDKIESLN